ncbi:hypothetical protein DV737_g3285, partial [Chaetothyriales sp. CBS 132003]
MAGPVRQPIDLKSLERWIDANTPEIKTPLDLKQFGFGQSNPTYQITSPDGTRYVVRKKPPGKLLSKTAHRVDREYQIISALAGTNVPVPKCYGLCEDDSVIGTPFYIMEFLDGRFITEPHFPAQSAEERHEMWRAAVTTLAKFHSVNYSAVGLSNFGKHSGFYDRQISTFSRLSRAQASVRDVETGVTVGDIPHFDDILDFFSNKEKQPKDRSSLIHGDYKIDNLVFHKTEPRVIGILDWEMATIGHPLSDFVNLVGPWTWAGLDENGQIRSNPEFSPGRTPGLPSLDQVTKWYVEESGYNVTQDLDWGNAFGGLRSSVIVQGIAARVALRQASGLTAKTYAEKLIPTGLWTWEQIKKLIDKPVQGAGNKAKL